MSITISKHAQERYAERIMDRDSKTDVTLFIKNHEEKIRNDIEKMLQYGSKIYSGKSTRDSRRNVSVIINGMWVVILDIDSQTVVTLYRIDLGVGDEANKVFAEKALAQIDIARKECDEVAERTVYNLSTYQSIINHNEETLSRYRRLIKEIEQQIAGYREMIKSINADVAVADCNLREKVEILIGKQHF